MITKHYGKVAWKQKCLVALFSAKERKTNEKENLWNGSLTLEINNGKHTAMKQKGVNTTEQINLSFPCNCAVFLFYSDTKMHKLTIGMTVRVNV